VASRVFKILFAEWVSRIGQESINEFRKTFHFQLGNVSCSAIKDD
jgi:hypothetical protein